MDLQSLHHHYAVYSLKTRLTLTILMLWGSAWCIQKGMKVYIWKLKKSYAKLKKTYASEGIKYLEYICFTVNFHLSNKYTLCGSQFKMHLHSRWSRQDSCSAPVQCPRTYDPVLQDCHLTCKQTVALFGGRHEPMYKWKSLTLVPMLWSSAIIW